ncbi:uncharacterized protein LOC126841287 [Adelges cooleyi]|uniref:uncharacterized protein LOC126841287 n=1 Tax=Adelges cooleyi TaxID=133065 RepID=UPI00217FB0B8|nr:uncharacterized protein LOC126841287 [Adelges cooleyi]
MTLVLFILVYFVSAALAQQIPRPLAGHKIEMTSAGNTAQYVQFDDLSYNMTDFTICTWIKLTNFTQAQTIFRLTGSKKETVFLWRLMAQPKQTIRVIIKGKLVASESATLAKDQWNHICFQWKSSTGIWAMFVNVKIHSVGQITASEGSNNTTAVSAWKLQGTGNGILGDDGAACRNRFQAYGLYMTGTAVTPALTVPEGGIKSSSGGGGGGKRRVVKRVRTDGAAPKNRRQAVYDDLDDPAGTAAPPTPFQWLGKAFAVMKRLFTFVIIPFFKFIRNTFFQTRTVDDTVVDVSETRFTISDVKFSQTLPDDLADSPSSPASSTTVSTTTTTTTVATVTAANGVQRDDDDDKQRSARQTDDERCAAADQRVTGDDLVSAAVDNAVSANAKRYLQMVSKSLSDIGVNAAFVRQAFMCCHQQLSSQANVINWDGTGAKLLNAVKSPAALACGQF